jgi:hypothetical protein
MNDSSGSSSNCSGVLPVAFILNSFERPAFAVFAQINRTGFYVGVSAFPVWVDERLGLRIGRSAYRVTNIN